MSLIAAPFQLASLGSVQVLSHDNRRSAVLLDLRLANQYLGVSRAKRSKSIVQFRRHVAPASNENDCCHRGINESTIHSNLTFAGLPPSTSSHSKTPRPSIIRPISGGSRTPGERVELHQIRHTAVLGSYSRSVKPSKGSPLGMLGTYMRWMCPNPSRIGEASSVASKLTHSVQ